MSRTVVVSTTFALTVCRERAITKPLASFLPDLRIAAGQYQLCRRGIGTKRWSFQSPEEIEIQ